MLRKNRQGFVEIGYIYALIISALVFVSFTTLVSKTVEVETVRSVRAQLYEVGGKIETSVNNAVIYANAHPNSSIDIDIEIPTIIGGSRYTILIKDGEMYMNSSAQATSVRFYPICSGFGVVSYNPRTDSVEPLQSSYGSINLIYSNALNKDIRLLENRD